MVCAFKCDGQQFQSQANIAEGFGKRGKADKARFMNIAEGSIEESRYYMILAQDLGLRAHRQSDDFPGRSQSLTGSLFEGHPEFLLLSSGFWLLNFRLLASHF